jgi:hypothetical protein
MRNETEDDNGDCTKVIKSAHSRTAPYCDVTHGLELIISFREEQIRTVLSLNSKKRASTSPFESHLTSECKNNFAYSFCRILSNSPNSRLFSAWSALYFAGIFQNHIPSAENNRVPSPFFFTGIELNIPFDSARRVLCPRIVITV